MTGNVRYFNKKGKLLACLTLVSGSTHNDRCDLAEYNGVNNWDYYEMHDSGLGMKKMDTNSNQWYVIQIGKIIGLAN